MHFVSRYGRDGRVYPLGRLLLGATNAEVENITTGKATPYDKTYAILEAWYMRDGCNATMKELLKVCDDRVIGIGGAVKMDLRMEGLLSDQ
eukprot:m.99082 g.99082  ORF g.99082 m.99082 type:complete len:91 (+) comp37033_c0_seq2:488-760(+)